MSVLGWAGALELPPASAPRAVGHSASGKSENTDQREQKRCPNNTWGSAALEGKMQGAKGTGGVGPGLG